MSRLVKAWLVLLGAVIDLGLAFAALVPSGAVEQEDLLLVGLAFLALVLGLAAIAFFVLRWRAFAIGLIAGHALLSLLTGGVCTLLNPATGTTDDAYLGLFGGLLYLMALGLAVLVLVIISIVVAARR